jgi:glycosyltransferase involved in cell wall biosynthesis
MSGRRKRQTENSLGSSVNGQEEGVILISQPVHQHAYETAIAAQSAFLLHRFVTGLYYVPLLQRAVGKFLPNRLAGFVDHQLRRRYHPELEPERVQVVCRFHVVATSLRLVLTKVGVGDGARLEHWAHSRFDRRVSVLLRRASEVKIVHGFQGASRDLFTKARERGLVAVLDAPSAYEWHVQAGLEETGVMRKRPGVERVRAERELADVVLAPSDYVIQCLLENGVAREKIVKLPYGVNAESFTPSSHREEKSPFRVAFFGSIARVKGISYLLEAWNAVSLPEAELLIVGQPQRDAIPTLRQFEGSYRWVPQVPKHAVARLLRQCDVVVLPSLSDGWSLILGEALASAVPVISTTSTGFPVRNGIDGFIVPPRSATALAERIAFLHTRPELRREMGARGRDHVLAHYTWQHYRRRLVAVYRAILSGSGASDEITAALEKVA